MYLLLRQWETSRKKMHKKSHFIICLPVHLPDMQPVYFYDDEEHQALERAAQRSTMLTAWFELNRTDLEANRYLLYSISPKDTERFHLRMLLFRIPGAKSFEELWTYDSITMESFKEAYHARNLLEDDGEW
ncbi:hypothetical protein AVEN_159664-1 [Araneus ventricosus]|uniref:Uncharacterized protein n=1 Tax=Araneus ventricosus TaxID=182803 RepID=A0A4Y2FGL3_ARAVE|nr:hypothetical protein AVEN_159664-1 [Araneus ventricosus]